MAALWWNSKRMTLSEAMEGIGGFMGAVAKELPRHGYTNVRHEEFDVNGEKNNHSIAVAHFYIGQRDFWQVVMCGGADLAVARANVDEIVGILAKLAAL